jgi:TM2 domain-containing membrane protein YozV
MKRNIFTLTVFVLSMSMLLFSCSVQKRYHSSGWNIQFGGGKSNSEASHARVIKKSHTVVAPIQAESMTVVTEAEPAVEKEVAMGSNVVAMDEVETKSATPAPLVTNKTKLAPVSKTTVKSVLRKINQTVTPAKMTAPAKTNGGDKSWLLALVLCFFVGFLGIHRFYLGYIWQGIFQLLTLGGFGIWSLIDLIRIIIRDLEPKDGSYSD